MNYGVTKLNTQAVSEVSVSEDFLKLIGIQILIKSCECPTSRHTDPIHPS